MLAVACVVTTAVYVHCIAPTWATSLAGNRLGNSGAVALCDGLISNSTLETLRLNSCEIATTGLTQLSSAVAANVGLVEL